MSTNNLVDGIRTITNTADGDFENWYQLKPGVDVNDVRCDFKVIAFKSDDSYL
jgi:hypothetical protein